MIVLQHTSAGVATPSLFLGFRFHSPLTLFTDLSFTDSSSNLLLLGKELPDKAIGGLAQTSSPIGVWVSKNKIICSHTPVPWPPPYGGQTLFLDLQ